MLHKLLLAIVITFKGPLSLTGRHVPRNETRIPITTDKIIQFLEVMAKKPNISTLSGNSIDVKHCSLKQIQTNVSDSDGSRTDSLEIIYPVQGRKAKNHTLSRGTSPYSFGRGEPPPPPRVWIPYVGVPLRDSNTAAGNRKKHMEFTFARREVCFPL